MTQSDLYHMMTPPISWCQLKLQWAYYELLAFQLDTDEKIWYESFA